MAFSEKIKLIAKRKSSFRCCICQKIFVEVHHIVPQADGGSDSLDNAAPLCSRCHDLYGGNPEKRKTIKQKRDHWWELMRARDKNLTETPTMDEFCEILENPNNHNSLLSKGILLYHVVLKDEGFDISTTLITNLISEAQAKYPNQRRLLYVDIDEHRNDDGGFDHDMFEFQRNFLLTFMLQYLTELHMPILNVKNTKAQINNVPEKVEIINRLDNESMNTTIDKGAEGIWLADRDKMLKI